VRTPLRISAALAAAALLVLGPALSASAALPPAQLVADVNPAGDSDPDDLVVYNGLLYFTANDGAGRELFVSTGSIGSATNLNINPLGSSDPFNFIVFNSKLYFVADDGVSGFEMWVVDGSNPAALVVDLEVGAGSSGPGDFTIFGAQLYFSAQVSGVGNELFSMSTSEIVTLVANIWPGASGSNPSDFYAYNGFLYFSAASDPVSNTELWRTDGASTTLYADLNPGGMSSPHYFSTAGGRLYFIANDGIGGPPYNYELWTTDGLTPPLQLTTDLANINGYQYFTVFNDTLFFSGGNAAVGQELGRTTGGSVPTFLDINPGPTGSSPQDFTAFNGQLWLTADNGANGFELMHTDGVSVPVLGPEVRAGAPSGDVYNLLASGSSLYFDASSNGTDLEIWLTNGTAVQQATSIFPAGEADPYGFTTLGGFLYFGAQSATGYELWRVQLSTLAAAGPGLAATGVEAGAVAAVAGAFVLAGGILLMRRRRELAA
jgi:LPXTG-motif cell wall-anchored protein